MTNQPNGAMADRDSPPPRVFWLIPLVVVVLRAIPFLLTRVAIPPAEKVMLPVGYNPMDWFAYAAFVRQAAETGDWLLANPYTEMAQDGRFLLPLFSLLGHLCRWTGLDAFWMLELARIPLVFLFFAVLWRFLGLVLPQPRPRLLAAWLVGFSGGIECLLLATLDWWPARSRDVILEALSDDQGWSTFAALNNPLWAAGLTLALIAIGPLLRPEGTQRTRDWVRFVAGCVATYLVHPYSGLFVLALAISLPAGRWILGGPGPCQPYLLRAGTALAAALGLIGALALWQNQDPVFRLTAGRVLGDHQLSVFWYPVALGGLGLLAARGGRHWFQSTAPHGLAVGIWIATVILMHASPLFNGYHFVFLLHLPVCLLAVPALDEVLQRRDSPRWLDQVTAALLLALVFQSAVSVTWRSAKRALDHQLPETAMAAIERLGREPPGRVYTSPYLGTIIPAYTSHRVYVGHWFLTPDQPAKQRYFLDLLDGRVGPQELVALVQRGALDYALLPPAMPPYVIEAIRPLANREVQVNGFTLLYLRRSPAP